jgi:hypothetical protein
MPSSIVLNTLELLLSYSAVSINLISQSTMIPGYLPCITFDPVIVQEQQSIIRLSLQSGKDKQFQDSAARKGGKVCWRDPGDRMVPVLGVVSTEISTFRRHLVSPIVHRD